MNPEFWQEKWQKNEIGFHLKEVHPLVVKYLTQDTLNNVKTVFVPLCGKTLDIGYFLKQGKTVIANELNEGAVQQLFEGLQLIPTISEWAGGKRYQADQLTVWVGDFFKLSKADINGIDLVYDRAALVALPESMRRDYVAKMQQLTPGTKQFLLTLAYDQSKMAGPPFSVSDEEVASHYGHRQLERLSQKDIIQYEPKFAQRGLTSFVESAFWIE